MSKKAFIALCCLVTSLSANASMVLKDFNQINQHLMQGHAIKAIMNFNKCSPSVNASGGMDFSTFNRYQINDNGKIKNEIATSKHMLVHNSLYGPVYDYIRLRVHENNTAEFFTEYLEPKTFALMGQASHYQCSLDDGGITFFDDTHTN